MTNVIPIDNRFNNCDNTQREDLKELFGEAATRGVL